MARKVLLVCGILSSLLYVAMNVFVPMQWEGYSCASRAVSELSAIGAPTRPLWVLLGIVYTLLFAAFGWGVRQSAVGNRSLRVVGGLIIAYCAVNLFWPPMHLRGTGLSLTDILHIVWTVMVILFMMLMMGFGAAALGKRFRLYTVASMVLLVVLGGVTGMEGPRIAANLPTPWVGVWQRIMIAVFLLWVAVLAMILLRVKKDDEARKLRARVAAC